MSQSSEQEAPERIWLRVGTDCYWISPQDATVEYTRSDICASLANALEGYRQEHNEDRSSKKCFCLLCEAAHTALAKGKNR